MTDLAHDNQDKDEIKGSDISVVVELPVGEGGASDAAPVVAPTQNEEVAALSRQVEETRAENARLAAVAHAAKQETNAARIESRDSTLTAIANAIEVTTRDLDRAESDLAAAMTNGDYKTAAKLQREIAKAESRQSELENSRVAIEQRMNQGERLQITEGRVPPSQPQPQRQLTTIDDMVEDLATRLTPQSATWLRAHKQVMQDPRKLGATHDFAVNTRGLKQDSAEYFQFLESELGISKAAPVVTAQPQPAQRAATFDAPVTRDTPSLSTGQTRSRVVNLTPRQQDMAKSMDMTNEEYARFLTEVH